MQRLKKNNQGFTLVELLVALTILAIIVVPFLHGFVVSARVNANAKKVLRATTAGTNVMELLKAESMDELLGRTYESEDTSDEVPGEGESAEITNSVFTYDESNGTYSFKFTETVDGEAFTVEGTLNPTTYYATDADGNVLVDAAGNTVGYNDAQSVIYDMNSASNAFVTVTEGTDSSSAESLAGLLESDTINFNQITRTITIDIEQSNSATSVFSTITYVSGGRTVYGMNRQCVFSTAGSEAALENVYLIYHAGFESGSTGQMTENIVINNTENYPVNVYLIKQNDTSIAAAAELSYRVNITVNQGSRSDFLNADNSYNVVTKIRTNVETEKITLSYTPTESVGTDMILAKDALGLTDLVTGDAEERLYQVSLKVYEQGDEAHEALYEMQGTKEK